VDSRLELSRDFDDLEIELSGLDLQRHLCPFAGSAGIFFPIRRIHPSTSLENENLVMRTASAGPDCASHANLVSATSKGEHLVEVVARVGQEAVWMLVDAAAHRRCPY
jgi:hypothetical protein